MLVAFLGMFCLAFLLVRIRGITTARHIGVSFRRRLRAARNHQKTQETPRARSLSRTGRAELYKIVVTRHKLLRAD
jgi:hypothetical protein